MKVIMLAGAPGSIDGFRVTTYEAGQEYDLTTSAGARELAVAFVVAGLAEEVGATSVPAATPEQPDDVDSQESSPVDDAAPEPPKPGRKPKVS
jgi:hypothetical protein